MKEVELLKKALLSKEFLAVWFTKLNKAVNIYFAMNYKELPLHKEMLLLYEEFIDEKGVLYYLYEDRVIAKSYISIEEGNICLYSIIKVEWFHV